MWTLITGLFGKISWKAVAILGILGGLSFMGYRAYTYHLEQLEDARVAERQAVILEQTQLMQAREGVLLEQANIEKLKVEIIVAEQKVQVKKLERMLLVEHDLNRLLQAKPGLILKRVNAGTEAAMKELAEATQ